MLSALARRSTLGHEGAEALIEACRRIETSEHGRSAALARQLRRHADAYLAEPDLAGLYRRDRHMAETLLENLPAEGITVVWAHNEHIARNPDNFGGPAMGHVLAQRLGPRYLPIGVMCGEGLCRAVDPSTGSDDYAAVPLPPMRPGTTDDALRRLGLPFVSGEQFSHPGPRRFIGWKIDTSLLTDRTTMIDTFEIDRPSSDFAAFAVLPDSRADATAVR